MLRGFTFTIFLGLTIWCAWSCMSLCRALRAWRNLLGLLVLGGHAMPLPGRGSRAIIFRAQRIQQRIGTQITRARVSFQRTVKVTVQFVQIFQQLCQFSQAHCVVNAKVQARRPSPRCLVATGSLWAGTAGDSSASTGDSSRVARRIVLHKLQVLLVTRRRLRSLRLFLLFHTPDHEPTM